MGKEIKKKCKSKAITGSEICCVDDFLSQHDWLNGAVFKRQKKVQGFSGAIVRIASECYELQTNPKYHVLSMNKKKQFDAELSNIWCGFYAQIVDILVSDFLVVSNFLLITIISLQFFLRVA